MPRWPREDFPFCKGVCQCVIFDETPPPTPEVDSDNEEYLATADLDDLVWSKEPVPDNQEYLCTHLIPRPATPPPQPNQVEIPPVPENMDIDILEGIPDLIDIPEEILQDFDVWKYSFLEYQWWCDI